MSSLDQLQVLEEAKNVLDLQISATEAQFHILQQQSYRYSRLGYEQHILHREIREITDEIVQKSSKYGALHNQTIISVLEIKKADLELQDNTICLELTSLRPYVVQYNKLSEERSAIHPRIRQLETDIKKIRMRSMYLEYLENEFDENTVRSILDGTFSTDLYEFCNRNHQERLLADGYFATNCPYVGCEEECAGWDTSEKRCQCGNYKGYRWEDECEKFDDILKFDLTSTVPLGYVTKNW